MIQLHKEGIENLSDILFAYVDSSDKINIYLKNKGAPASPTL
ncbi:MAG: hypothetical protein E6940_01975 [Clostridium septicum]|nr:hypothetical protein [Clostridium septicum]MDU1312809.1 hypothetical protein [Clostridium septicum]